MLRLGRAQRVGGRHPDLHLPVELEQPARHRAAAAAALRGAARHHLGSAPAAARGVGVRGPSSRGQGLLRGLAEAGGQERWPGARHRARVTPPVLTWRISA